jgi:competence protein ComEA
MFSKEQKKILLYILVILIIGTAVTLYRIKFKTIPADYIEETSIAAVNIPNPVATPKLKPAKAKAVQTILVHVAGAVQNPGVYKLKSGLRGLDAIQIAGGLLPVANLDKVNLAKKLKDGQRLNIPFIKGNAAISRYSQKTKTANKKQTSEFPININLANEAQLVLIPGIGKSTAKKIMNKRIEAGKYSSAEDLLKVKGIGPKKLEKIKEYITL